MLQKCELLKNPLAVKAVTLEGVTHSYSQEAFEALRQIPSRQEELLANLPEAASHIEFVQAALRNGVVTNLEQKPKVPVQLQLGLKLAFQNDLSELEQASNLPETCVEYGDSDGRVFFTDYAPWTFREIRRVCGLDEEHFQRALSCSAEYRIKATEGLSYCNFYFVDDPCFMLKEIHPAEADQLRGMLSDMLQYFSENPNSTMVRCVGLYKLTWHSTVNGVASVSEEWMICMANLFSTDVCMHNKYDLKGSREGRCVAPEELAQGKEGRFTLRDYAFEEIEQVINIGPDMAAKFLSQLQKDVQLLCDNNVMDYSLLVGVHHRNGPARKCTPTEYQHTNTIFEVEKGGIPSACGKKIYFIGLVDNLTGYTAKKDWETVFKSCLYDPAEISSVPPSVYMERFMRVATERIR